MGATSIATTHIYQKHLRAENLKRQTLDNKHHTQMNKKLNSIYQKMVESARVKGRGNVNPKDINFMQDSIKNATGDFTVLENVEAIKNGTLKVTNLPAIRIWKDADGKIWTLDHRRLATFKLSGVDNIPVEWVTDDVVQSQMWKMTTKTDGVSIKLKLGGGNNIIVE